MDENLNAKGMSRQIGNSGTHIFGGIITGEEYNRRLTGREAIRQYDIMRRSDATVHSLISACTLPIIQADWRIEAASEDESDQEVAAHLEHELFHNNVNWSDFVREALGMLTFGFSVAEKTIALADYDGKSLFGIESLGFRKQTSVYKWEMENGEAGITQQLISNTVSIPMAKLLVFTNDKEGDNYEGISILRYVFKDWDMKDKLGLVLAIALEKAGVPTPILTVPKGAAPSDIDDAILNLRQLRSNEEGYLKKPEGWEIDILDMSGQTTKDILPTIQYHDRQIVRSALAQFLELGSTGASGSRSLSEDSRMLFEKSLEAVAKNLRDTIQKDLIDRLCDMNYTNLPNGKPMLQFGKFSQDDIAAKTEAVNKLVTSGTITPNYETENAMRVATGLPVLPEDMKDEWVAPKAMPAVVADPTVKATIKKARKARSELIDILVRD